MTSGDDGAGRPSGLSRRRLLAGIGGVGAVGMASGLGTGAYLADRETFPDNAFGAGSVELLVNGAVTGGTLAVDVSRIDRGASGSETFEIGVQTNPVRVWLATVCPDAGDDLANALEAEVVVDGESVTDGHRSLAAVGRDLVAGRRIDSGCLAPDASVVVEVHWRLPADAPDVGGETTGLQFRLYAEQCRHVTEEDAAGSNPFADLVCEGPECVPCADENGVTIGSLTLRYIGDDPANVAVAAVGGGAGGKGTGGTVVFDDEVDPDETFVVDGSASPTGDPAWIGPNIYLDDGTGGGGGNGTGNNGNGNGGNSPPGVNIHTSCSASLAPGDIYGDFEIVSMTTTDGEPICGAEAL